MNDKEIKLDKKQSNISNFYFIILLAAFICIYNADYGRIRIGISLSAITKLLVIGVGLFYVIKNNKFKFNAFTKWSLIFIFFLLISVLWAVDTSRSTSMLYDVVYIYAIFIILSMLIDNKEDVNKLMIIVYLSLILCAIYVLENIDLSTLGDERLDAVGDNSWNANSIGGTMCVGVFLSLYCLLKYKNIVIKLFNIVSFILFSYLMLMSGSRTAFLMAVFFICFMLFMRAKGKKKILALGVIVIFIALMFNFVMTNEAVYNVLGKRLEEAINGLFGSGTTEGSFNERNQMIKLGLEWFTQKPILGYGVGNFATLYGQFSGWEVYSHNNFIEMLVGGGVVGFVIFYSIYAYLLVMLYKKIRKTSNFMAVILFAAIISMLLLQISSIVYFSGKQIVFLMLGCSYVKIKE